MLTVAGWAAAAVDAAIGLFREAATSRNFANPDLHKSGIMHLFALYCADPLPKRLSNRPSLRANH